MSADFNKSADMFTIYWGEVLVGMFSTLTMPNGAYKFARRVHRTVILPDYQGLGIGTKLLDFFGNYYINNGCKFFIKSTHVRIARHCKASKSWLETATSGKAVVKGPQTASQTKKYKNMILNRPAYSFEYVGADYTEKPHCILKYNGDRVGEFARYVAELKQTKYVVVVTNDDNIADTIKQLGVRTEQQFTNHKEVKKYEHIRECTEFV